MHTREFMVWAYPCATGINRSAQASGRLSLDLADDPTLES